MSEAPPPTTAWEPATARRRLGVGVVWTASATALSLACGLLGTTVLVRSMSHAAYGALAVGSAIAGFAGTVGGLGLAPAIARYGVQAAPGTQTRARVYATARVALPIAWFSAAALVVVSAVIAVATQSASGLGEAGLVVAVLIPVTAAAPFQAVVSGYLNAMYRPQLSSVMQSSISVTQLGLTLVAVVTGLTAAYQIAVTRLIVGLAGFGALVGRLWSTGDLRAPATVAAPRRRQLLGFGSAMTLTTMTGILISQLDVFVLGIARGTPAAGIYAPVSRLADVAMLVPATVATYLMPAIASVVHDGERDLATRLYHWASRWGLVVAAPGIAALLLAPDALIHMLFGNHVEGMSTPARVLALGVFVHFAFGFNGVVLDAFGEPVLVAVRSGYSVLLSVAACAVLIPRYGATGAALSTLVAIAGFNVFCSVALFRRHRIPPWDGRVAAVVAALAGGMLVSGAILRLTSVSGIAALALAAGPCSCAVLALASPGEGLRPWIRATRRNL